MTNLADNKVTARYAKAIFDLALENNALDAVHEELGAVSQLFEKSPALTQFLENPAIPVQDKLALVNTQVADKLKTGVANLIRIMTENNRLLAFPALAAQFEALLKQHRQVAVADVLTAVPLDQGLSQQLQQALKKRYGYTDVEIANRVDPGILGGVVIRMNDTVIDGSYIGKLESLRKELSHA
ncbi:MAG: ATP synthase F1 subunit delta [Candidatus Melainabacteria bacterium]